MRTIVIISIACLAALAACTSPLDLQTKRVDTRLTTYLTTTHLEVRVLSDPGDTFAIPQWLHVVEHSYLAVDTVNQRYWVDYTLKVNAFSDGANQALQRIHVRLDSVPASGVVYTPGNPDIETGCAIATSFNPTDTVYNAYCTLGGHNLPAGQLTGSFLINAKWWGNAHARIIIDFTAERE